MTASRRIVGPVLSPGRYPESHADGTLGSTSCSTRRWR